MRHHVSPRIGTWARQTAHVASVVAVVAIIVGFAVLVLGGYRAATNGVPVEQIPYVVSGGVVGVGLLGFGCAIVNLQVGRHTAAREHTRLLAVRDAARNLLSPREGSEV